MLWKLLSESLKPARHKTRAERSEWVKKQTSEGGSKLLWVLLANCRCDVWRKRKKETRKQNAESRKRKSESGRRKLDIENRYQVTQNSRWKPFIRKENKTKQWRFFTTISNFGWPGAVSLLRRRSDRSHAMLTRVGAGEHCVTSARAAVIETKELQL